MVSEFIHVSRDSIPLRQGVGFIYFDEQRSYPPQLLILVNVAINVVNYYKEEDKNF
jgi:hypothetical protein